MGTTYQGTRGPRAGIGLSLGPDFLALASPGGQRDRRLLTRPARPPFLVGDQHRRRDKDRRVSADDDPDHQRQVVRALEKSLERDHSKITVSEVTSLGLVQITRKRTRESLAQLLCEPCAHCQGRGIGKIE